jgi:ribosomal protein L37AE/L43A
MTNAIRIEAITDNRPKLEALSYLPKLCLECGKEIESSLKQFKKKKFCCKLHQQRYNSRNFRKRHNLGSNERMPKLCFYCKKKIDLDSKRSATRIFCSNSCRDEYLGLTHEKDAKFDSKLNELAERQESNPKLEMKPFCEVCGRNGQESRLILHHVRYNPIETVTLCSKCHSRLHLRLLKKKKVKPYC